MKFCCSDGIMTFVRDGYPTYIIAGSYLELRGYNYGPVAVKVDDDNADQIAIWGLVRFSSRRVKR